MNPKWITMKFMKWKNKSRKWIKKKPHDRKIFVEENENKFNIYSEIVPDWDNHVDFDKYIFDPDKSIIIKKQQYPKEMR